MEEDEMEMTREELQKWIRGKVKEDTQILNTLEKCTFLQSLLDKKMKQSAHIQKLSESVAACEAITKKLYKEMHSDPDSDDDDCNTADFGNANSSPQKCVRTETQAIRKNPFRDNDRKTLICLNRKPVVVLTRLSPRAIKSFPHVPHNNTQREEDGDSSDSFSRSNNGTKKRRRIEQTSEKANKRFHAGEKSNISRNTGSESDASWTPQANANRAESSTVKTPAAATKIIFTTCCAPCPLTGPNTTPTLVQSSQEATETKAPPSAPQGEITVNMKVLARSRSRGWQLGKIVEMVTQGDGRLKYKVGYEDNRRILVSGHHVAFACREKRAPPSVGARVVVKRDGKEPQYCAGIVAEVPREENRMRFMVFMDDQTPVYAGLPLIHPVCKPLPDPLDDILDEGHKNFMKEYIKRLPNPPRGRYRVGQMINAELDGVQQKCEVKEVDCSLMRVVFQSDQRENWIYRGSTRLEHMNMKEHLDININTQNK